MIVADEGGVFKAKDNNKATKGAREVEESEGIAPKPLKRKDTVIVDDNDQSSAEEVDVSLFYDNFIWKPDQI